MPRTIQRFVFSSFILGVAVAGLAVPAHAQSQRARWPVRMAATSPQLIRAELKLQRLVNQLNVMTKAARAQAQARARFARVTANAQPRGGNRAFPVPSCGAIACSQRTVDKVTASITLGPQMRQLYNSMPGVPAILR